MTYSSTVNTYQLSSLQTETTYYWRVAPENICGQGTFSSTYSFTTAAVVCNVVNSTENLTHKMVARACKGRRLTSNTKCKIRNALNHTTDKTYSIEELFNY